MMTDKEIIALYFKRSENAIEQTDEKYGRLCHSISINILNDTRDSEECVNDTYLTLWNVLIAVRNSSNSTLSDASVPSLTHSASSSRDVSYALFRFLA